ncbi:Nramp family divalent metal transporter [Prosthecobacter sp.]|uniref:Nramp family divalent metal transporter n=1 Tax=Prosthecobacter sp. TaxID=1965333 RepID=UPI002AB9483B|nr:Nramp family divalent metal transporter [Prosthecobacter sp.]MDZ4402041.1 Nramp family divalent metal transporter [Prosthecobacter sp.]
MNQPEPAPSHWAAILRSIGPGLIITASIVGSGEVIATPKVAGEAGFTLLWFIVLGCFIKVFVQVELGRYAVSTGQTTLEAMNSIPGPRFIVSWLLWLWLGMFVALVFQVAGIVGGVADIFAAAGLTMDKKLLAIGVGGSCAVLLALGRYRLVESLSVAMVVLFTLATVIAVGSLQWSPYAITAANVVEGFQFKLPENFVTAFGAFGIIGVGASELIYYPYWCLEKGYAVNVGPQDGTPQRTVRAQGWMRVMRIDAWISFVIYTLATLAFYMLGAAVLHSKGLQVNDQGMIDTLAHMYAESFGSWSLYVFLVGAFFALYSTIFASTASNARLLVDAAALFKVVRYPTPEHRVRAVKVCVVLLPALSVGLYMLWEKPVTLVLIGAVSQGIMLPFLAGAALYFRHCRLDRALRPGFAWTLCLWIAALSMAAIGAYQVVQEIMKAVHS